MYVKQTQHTHTQKIQIQYVFHASTELLAIVVFFRVELRVELMSMPIYGNMNSVMHSGITLDVTYVGSSILIAYTQPRKKKQSVNVS